MSAQDIWIRRIILWLIPMWLLVGNVARASHSVGADLTYTWISGNTYKVTLTFYRDCNGIPAPSSPNVSITSASTGKALFVTCTPRPGTCQEVTPKCSSTVTVCSGGTFTGIQECVYDGTVTLPNTASDWVFSYSLCCRNAAITTVPSASTNTFYIYATLNNLVAGNNSPTFTNKPVPFVCRGQQYCFNHGANDVDGDVLIYEPITPLQNATTPVVYNSPYSAIQPLNSIPAVTFDSITGDICMTPQSIETTIMAVLVKEYRNGVLIGSVERDMQVNIINCSNTLPTVSGINGTTNYEITACPNSQLCFDLFSTDADTTQSLTVNWNQAITGATLTTTTSSRPKATFCWTPSVSNVGKSYTFTVKVTDNACPYYGQQIFAYTINVVGLTVNAGADQQINCGSTTTLTATATGGGTLSYSWNTGATTSSITAGIGTYIVQVNNGGCVGTDTVLVSGSAATPANFTVNNGCIGSSICFTNTTPSPTFYQWSFDDGASASTLNACHTFSTAGSHTVTLIAGDSFCHDTVTKNITVYAKPSVSLASGIVCSGSSITLDAGNAGATYSWNTGATTKTISVSDSGNYNVTVTNTNGCTVSASTHISSGGSLNSTPVTMAICPGSSTTLDAGNPGSTYQWSTGATTQQISVNTAGNYSVTVTNTSGCSIVINNTVSNQPLPTVNFSTVGVCIGAVNSFSNSSTISSGSIASAVWNFGDGGSANTTSTNGTTHTYAVPGNYTVTLTVTSAAGCTASATQSATVYPKPTASFTATNACLNQPNTFTNTSTISGGSISSWALNYGDGSAPVNGSSSTNTHTYSNSGSYQVQLIATSQNGCSDTAVQSVAVRDLPVANFTCGNTCVNAVLNINDNSTASAGFIAAWDWNFGDGQTSNDQNPAISYDTAGQQSIKLVVTNDLGCADSMVRQVMIWSPPEADFSTGNNCFGSASEFRNKSNARDGYITELKWTFGDKTSAVIISNGFTIGDTAHMYAAAGIYKVDLEVTTNYGCRDTSDSTIIIYSLPDPQIQTNNVCKGDTVQLNDIGTHTGVGDYNWSLGDGSFSTSSSLNHLYSNAGSYKVALTVIDTIGCRATDSLVLNIYPQPVLSFTGDSACYGTANTFKNTSSIPTGNISSWQWSFGDGGTSNSNNATHQYTSPGTYSVTLTAGSDHGCTATTVKQVSVKPLPVAMFIGGGSGCSTFTANFQDLSTVSSGSISKWIWDFGDGSISMQQNPTHSYSQGGTYNVVLTAISSDGCMATYKKPGTVVTYPSPEAKFNSGNTGLEGFTAEVRFNNLSTNYTSAIWDFGDGTLAFNETNPLHKFTGFGKYNVKLIVTNAYGCADTINSIIDIKGISTLFVPNAFTPNSDGHNDNFQPKYTQLKDIEVTIWDRWGTLLANWSTLDGSWDGTYKGHPVPDDVYVYKVTGTGEDEKYYDLTGALTVVH